ncbi:unnamed protein product [Trichobilharzia szidati]|nr:unnamed protein product [Trichobilharzia szidati]
MKINCSKHLLYLSTISLFICFTSEIVHDSSVNISRETRKFFTRSEFDLHIDYLTLSLITTNNHSVNKIYEPNIFEKCYTHIDTNQCHIVLGICVAEVDYINNKHQHISVQTPILIKHHENLIQAYNRTPSFAWEIYNDLLPVGCEIGHEQIMTGVLNINTSINQLNLTYNLKLSTMIKNSLQVLFNVYHLTSNGDLWLIDQLSTVLSRVELNQPWKRINLFGSDNNSNSDAYQESVAETTLNTSSSSSLSSTAPLHFNISVKYRYSCSLNYYGENCNYYCKPRDSKLGHYHCHPQTGELVCNRGWTGARCNQALCRKGCKHGNCIGPELCSCFDGWTGSSCDQCITMPGCLNGHCFFNMTRASHVPFTCECESGWTGMLCNINARICDQNPNICHNHGVCINQPDPNGLKVPYRCECLPGYYGIHCEKQIIDCKFHGCNQRGECQKDGICMCNSTYYGTFCQFNQTTCDENPCLGNQSKCHERFNEITADNSEQTTLKMRQFKCQCEQGRFGENCEFDIDECLSKPCQNGGHCVDLINGYQCICPPRFTGSQCQLKLSACQNNSCANGGECLDESISFQCNCLTGWKGITCRENINECSEIPRQTGRSLCQNNAGCRDLLGSYKCLCSSAWEGKHCEIPKLNNINNNDSNKTQYHLHSQDNCLHNQFVNETIRKDRLYRRYNEFIMLFLILTITFLIAIFAFSGGILFFCTSYKYQKVRKSNSSSLLSLFRNKSMLRSNENSPSELTKTREHRTLNSHRFVYSIHQQQQRNSNDLQV